MALAALDVEAQVGEDEDHTTHPPTTPARPTPARHPHRQTTQRHAPIHHYSYHHHRRYHVTAHCPLAEDRVAPVVQLQQDEVEGGAESAAGQGEAHHPVITQTSQSGHRLADSYMQAAGSNRLADS